MSSPVIRMALRQRLPATVSAVIGLIAMTAVVGALFPAVGHTIGKLNIPKGASDLLGGAEYGTVTGWFRSEIASIYGPLLTAGLAIAAAAATIAGEEEDRILALVLAYPITRSRLIAGKAGAVAIVVVLIACGAWVAMIAGVALAGGGISVGRITAFAVQLAFYGVAAGALAVAVAAATGRRSLTTGVAAGIAIAGWLINGFAPLVSGLAWLKYLSFFYYYAGRDPLTHGVDLAGVAVLGAAALALTAFGMAAIDRRDLRA